MTRRANIFVNYRRGDSAGHAGRLFDRLSHRFPGRVFMDVDTIQPGIDFVESIEQAVGCCEVLIVMIGREWLSLKDENGRRRLDDPGDFVRLEIASALNRDIRIIPVLVEGAAMPRLEDLPADLARLTRLNAIELSDARWTFDGDRLIMAIEQVLLNTAPSALVPIEPAPARPRRKVRTRAWMALNAAVLLGLALWIGWRFERQPAPQPPPSPTLVKPEVSPAVAELQPRPVKPAMAKPVQKQPVQKPTLKKRTVNALKTAGRGITSLMQKVKRESPRQR